MWSPIIIIIIVLIVLSSPKKKKSSKFRRGSKKKTSTKTIKTSKKMDSFSLPVDYDHRRYMSQNVPELLQSFDVFSASFLSRFASEYISSGKSANFTEEDLLSNVDPKYAYWVLNHCLRLASSRYNNLGVIKNAERVEAKYVVVKLFNMNSNCSKVPKKDKKYKINTDIPLFPCADCKEDKICGIWYKLDW